MHIETCGITFVTADSRGSKKCTYAVLSDIIKNSCKKVVLGN